MDETKQVVEVEKSEDRVKLLIKLNNLRKLLMEKGILIKGAVNDFDNYEYFSEAQYKELFTELFSKCGIGFNSTETNVQLIDGTDKQKFGVFVTIEFQMSDVDTGYTIKSIHSGIAFDKGDKALYKAKLLPIASPSGFSCVNITIDSALFISSKILSKVIFFLTSLCRNLGFYNGTTHKPLGRSFYH